MKPAAAFQCFFNQTHCACGSFELSSSICLNPVGTQDGKTVCFRRPCSIGYKCDCEGKNLCAVKKEDEIAFSLLPGSPADASLVYCGLLVSAVEHTSLVEGAPLPTPAPIAVNSQNAWTPTQCMCSKKVDVHPEPTECLHYMYCFFKKFT